MKVFSLARSTALVTGSSQGIGLAIGNALREADAKIVFHGLQARPENIPADSAYVQADLMQSDGPACLVAEAFATEPNLDTLVCNAGSFFDVPFLEMTRERWDNTLHVNAGNMVMADGSAQQFSQQGLAAAMASSGDSRNCALKPN